MHEQLFISDLHLAPERPQIIKLFERFIDEIAVHAESLYILGDFVEYWIGDDDKASGLDAAFSSLHRLHRAGTKIYFMHGNRDFLVSEQLAQRHHFQLIDDPLIETINGESVLFMHGDTLCTDDLDYQKFRAMVRNPEWQQAFLSKPLDEREQIALSLRETSQQATQEKSQEIMDVNQQTVIQTMTEHSVTTLVHGHTHRPGIHAFEIDHKPAKRIVLGDWYEKGSYLSVNSNTDFELNTFS